MACIFRNAVDIVATYRIAVADDIAVHFELVAIISIQSIISTEPDKAVMILEYRGYRIVGKTILYTQVFYCQVLALKSQAIKQHPQKNWYTFYSKASANHLPNIVIFS